MSELWPAVRSRLPWFLRRGACTHLDQVQDVRPRTDGCEECLKLGDEWVHLRMCLSCGKVGCCDQSKNKHATRHFHETAHPLVVSREPGESWVWCYLDATMARQ